ncbi:Zeta toxin [Rubripirellula tenax]|uniref:Zeta toxin n=1 Tax=Rubripirellula tenax TaxID=2528015 RepID=A0A5C6EQA5_9BACT|nr:bifunctional aminoglycoside phosphotransferase/ATP-binding protein [Rubripirellula tenax]TWU50554.1 Zeta toxin [Rubripirellula tenax]
MATPTDESVCTETLIAGLQRRDAYPHPVNKPVVVHQTHISLVFLAGEYAYKVKKPIKTDFLDYSTLGLREYCCHEELRLDRRYADDLYLDVVPVTLSGANVAIQGDGEPIEYAVKMRRFPAGTLLSERVDAGKLTSDEVFLLAKTVAMFHQSATRGNDEIARQWPGFLVSNVHQIIETLQQSTSPNVAVTLKVLRVWSSDFFGQHLDTLTRRIDAGYVRECHGDLHLANVVHWGDKLVPFDGIEFNDHLRWIDVLSDAAFLAMDLAARGHLDLSRSFMNLYLQHTGDYDSMDLLRLFLFYRALVRALTASMRSDENDVRAHVDLAYRFTLRETPQLWITHGVSGSGKTTLSEAVVQRHEAIRLRSDVERKRLFGLSPTDRPDADLVASMYCDDANEKTYRRLSDLAAGILRAGYSVIIDATFLKRSDRQQFHELAKDHGVSFAILDCHSDPQTLRQRVADRDAHGDDASDADLAVLQHQLAHQDPLSDAEREHVVDVPDTVQIAEHL